MRVAPVLFRFRVAVMVLLHLIGFVAPWNYFTTGNHGSLWLAACTLLARTGWFSLSGATLAITLLGLACLAAGTVLRVWATAYLGPRIMQESALQGRHLVAAGPYGYLRNPLYLGTGLIALATSLLMPPDGAALFLAAYVAFLVFLITTEERFLSTTLGQPYLEYCRAVPRILPHLPAQVRGSAAQPHWLRALLSETYPVGFTLCFAIFAWRYNARILIQCLLICYGVSLVMRAVNATAKDTNAP